MDWVDVAIKCSDYSGKKQMHVNDMAKIALEQRFCSTNMSIEDVAHKISSSLSRNVKKKTRYFKKVKNKKGGEKRGVYSYKNFKSVKLVRTKQPNTTTNYTSKAGENAVLSELLFYGFNASIMTVD